MNITGLPRQLFVVEPVPEPVSIEEPPHHHLWLGVFVADPAHIVAAGGFVVYV